MPVNIKLNQNEAMSSAYGKYYLEVATSEVLSTEGLVNHITHHNCAVGTEAIAAVIKKLGECIPELVAQGQPVKIDGLGIFYPTAENKKNGLLKSQLLDSKVNPLDVLAGVHLRFRPQSDDLNDLTSKWLSQKCTLSEFRSAGGFPTIDGSSSGSNTGGGNSGGPSTEG